MVHFVVEYHHAKKNQCDANKGQLDKSAIGATNPQEARTKATPLVPNATLIAELSVPFALFYKW
jgi:hypothetical protein